MPADRRGLALIQEWLDSSGEDENQGRAEVLDRLRAGINSISSAGQINFAITPTFGGSPIWLNVLDYASIQAAHDALPSTGGNLYVPPGTHNRAATLTISKNNVTLFGAGPSSIVKATLATFNLITLSTVTGFRLMNLQLQGAATTNGTTQYAVSTTSPATVIGGLFFNLFFSGPDASTGFNNGIKFDTGSDSNKIIGCTFERLIGAISGTGYGILLGEANHNTVSQNRFIGAAAQGRHAVYLSAGASYNIVSQNRISGFNEENITISSTAAQPTNQYNEIVDNICSGGGSASSDSGCIGVYGDSLHNLIKGNTVTGFNGWGVMVSDNGQTGLTKFTKVALNTVIECQLGGIVLQGSKNSLVKGNYVYNNSQASLGTYNGISIRGYSAAGQQVDDGAFIQGNYVHGSQHRNALEVDASAITPTNVTIAGNKFLTGWLRAVSLNAVVVTMFDNPGQEEISNGAAEDSRTTIKRHFSATAALNFDLTAVATQDLTVTVTGAALSDTVTLGVPNASLTADTLFWAWVSSADTVTVRAMRIAGTPNPASGTFRVDVWRH